jgi:hypothetical protein
LTAAYQRDKRARDIEFFNGQFQAYESYLNNELQLLQANGETKGAIEEAIIKKQIDLLELRNRLQAAPLGPQQLSKGDNLEKALQRAQQLLTKVNADIAGTKAQIAGGDKELTEFITLLQDPANKSLFPLENEKLEKLIEALKKAKISLEDLKAEAANSEQLARDIERISSAAQGKMLDGALPLGDGVSPLQKFLIDYSSGKYTSNGPIDRLNKDATDATQGAQSLGRALDKTLTEGNAEGENLEKVTARLVGLFAALGQNASSVQIGEKLAEVRKQIQEFVSTLPALPGVKPEESTKILSSAVEESVAQGEAANKKAQQYISETDAKLKEMANSAGGAHKNIIALQADIAGGKYKGASESFIQDMIDRANKLDAAAKNAKTSLASLSKIQNLENSLPGQIEELKEREADLAQRFASGTNSKLPAEVFRQTNLYTRKVNEVELAEQNGIITPEHARRLLETLKNLRDGFRDVEVGDYVQKEQVKNKELERSLMFEGDAREAAANDEINRLQEIVARTQEGSVLRLQAEQALTEKTLLLHQKLVQDSPLGKAFKAWGDLSTNLGNAATGWIDSFSDGLAQMVVKGKFDFKALADSIITDLVRIGIRAAMFNMISPLIPGMPAPTVLSPVRHSGGMADNSGFSRRVPSSLFANAQRYHGGGFPGLTRDEIPIIAKKGEEVDWPHKLAQKYGGKGVSQHNKFHVTVAGSGGTPEQNDDLAKKMSRALQDTADRMVTGSIQKQMRQGGLLAGGR